MTAQLFLDMSIDDYHSKKDSLGKSMLADLDLPSCPAKFKWKHIDNEPEVDKDFYNIGNAVHTLALEPILFKSRFHILPEGLRRDKRMEPYKDQIADADGRKMITYNDYQDIKGMAKSLTENKKALALLEGAGKIEASIFWEDPDTKLSLRCRPDLMRDDGLIVNIKTAASAERSKFFDDAWKFHYDISAAMESEGYKALTGHLPENYVLLVIEKEPPYIVEAYDTFRPIEDEVSGLSYYEVGVYRFRRLLEMYSECSKTDYWPSYNRKVEPMGVPFRAHKLLREGL